MAKFIDKLKNLTAGKQYEFRDTSCQVGFNETEEGIFEGYIVVWEQIDSYRSRFARGSFAKTIKEDFSKMKIFYDHDRLAGKPLEMREDDKGVFVRGKFNLNTSAGNDAWQFVKDKTVDGLSFRFRATRPDKFIDGIREIQEVRVIEFGPVIFPSGEKSKITSYRKTFEENFDAAMVYRERSILISSLVDTLDEVFYEMMPDSEDKVKAAIMGFLDGYLDWMERYSDLSSSQRSAILAPNSLALEVRNYIEAGGNIERFSDEEINLLAKGKLIENRSKIDYLPRSIRSEHKAARNALIEELCSELRMAGELTGYERERISNLLDGIPDNRFDELQSLLKDCQGNFK